MNSYKSYKSGHQKFAFKIAVSGITVDNQRCKLVANESSYRERAFLYESCFFLLIQTATLLQKTDSV